MCFFRKRKARAEAAKADEETSEATEQRQEVTEAGSEQDTEPESEAPDLGPQDAGSGDVPEGYLDLGALYVPRIKGLQIRGNFEPDKVTLKRVLLVLGTSGITVSVAAAPKSSGSWPELAEQISQAITGAGGKVEEVQGRYGLELSARVATPLPDGKVGLAPLRIIGVEGPRWLVRIDMQGAAAAGDKAQARALEALIDTLMVKRDDAPRIRFELLPLRLPREVLQSSDPS